jgi:homopolymeric O-antigen transport system permease protein
MQSKQGPTQGDMDLEAALASADYGLFRSHDLPVEPIVKIRSSPSLLSVDLKQLWAYRELLYFLIWRDLKVRYKQTALGAAWAIIQPFFTMIIFTLFFGNLAHVPSDNIPYPVFVYAGLLIWTFFSNAVSNSGNSLVGNQNLLTKVYFPRVIIPTATVGAGLVDFVIAFVILIGMMLYYRVSVTWTVLLVPAIVLFTTLLSLAVGLWVSALNVKYRDVRFALPFLIQVWMFLSPVIYPSSFVPANWRWLLMLNPLTGLIDNFRAVLFAQTINWTSLSVSVGITLALVVYAAYLFKQMERTFADIV